MAQGALEGVHDYILNKSEKTINYGCWEAYTITSSIHPKGIINYGSESAGRRT